MNNLEKQLWAIADDLRGNMDASEFKNYMLGFIFIKYLSEKVECVGNEDLKSENIITKYADLTGEEEYLSILLENQKEALGYSIHPKYLFSSFIKKISTSENIIGDLSEALVEIEKSTSGLESSDDFIGLFDDIDLSNNKLGATGSERNALVSKIIVKINDIEGLTENDDNLGAAYEFLIKQFASSAGKKGGEFYTPEEISEVVSKLAINGREKVQTIYDPTCGSGSLLLKAAKQTNFYRIYGQELNVSTYNLARMNMFLHGIKFRQFDLKQGDTLINDKFSDFTGSKGFDAIVANPPFGVKWDSDLIDIDEDDRFSKYGKLAPKSKGEYAFLQHMIYHLNDTGVMVSVVPLGVLFRGASEGNIRRYMIEEENVVDTVIGLPSNLFYGTPIPACIIVFRKNRATNDEVLFIDATKGFEKQKNQNILRKKDIDKIVETSKERKVIDKYSYLASIEEIKENNYNLNIPRYVDTFEEEEPIDLHEVAFELAENRKQQAILEDQIKEQLKELGINSIDDLRGSNEGK